jgi:hypothetical protein
LRGQFYVREKTYQDNRPYVQGFLPVTLCHKDEYGGYASLEDFKILDIGLGSIYGTAGISEDENRHTTGV